jgi:hypothetical protein
MKYNISRILLLILICAIIFLVFLKITTNIEKFENNHYVKDSILSLLFLEIDYPIENAPIPDIVTSKPPKYKPTSFILNSDGTVPDEIIRQMLIGKGIITGDQPLPQDQESIDLIDKLKNKLLFDLNSAEAYPPVPKNVPQMNITTPPNYDQMSTDEQNNIFQQSSNDATNQMLSIGNAQRAYDSLQIPPRPFSQFYQT